MKSRTRAFYRMAFFSCIGLLCVALSLSGCEPLRKKFTRKNKKERAESTASLPILEPEDYPDKPYDPLKEYKYHYSMWNVWYKDYLMTMEENASDKRQVYLLNQMAAQLDEMELLLAADKQQEFAQVKLSLQQVVESFKTSAPLRSAYITKSKVTAVDKKIRDHFRPEDVQNSLK